MSKIEWTGKTWNPIVGCSRISEGCRHCYAERMARRLAAMGQAKYQGAVNEHGRWSGQVWFDAPSYDLPLKVKSPNTWFVNSMSDLFHDGVSINWIMRVWDVMKDCPQHTFQILTKRAERLGKLLATDGLLTKTYGVLPNVWLGVSVENQNYTYRIDHLRQTMAHIRFLSLEPLIGPLPELDLSNIHWVICGGESGPDARPMHPDWARGLRDQCVAAGVPYFFKQWGEWGPEYANPSHKMVRMGKKAAGCLLDGREWKEMPVANRA